MLPTIRQATIADRDQLEALQRLASFATGEHRQELIDNPEVFGISAENIPHSLVAEQGNVVVGFCTVLSRSAGIAEVDAIFIDPAAWRRGIGRMLLLDAERRAINAGTKRLEVTSGRYAVSFYQALGFQLSGTEMTEFGPAARLTKDLEQSYRQLQRWEMLLAGR